jgi:purine nucleoside permease
MTLVDGDLAFEIDARQIPENWPTGYYHYKKEVLRAAGQRLL